MHKLKTNILVIGSGLSGATAALSAAEENKKVILLTKHKDLLSGNTPWAQGGIAYTNSKDTPKKFQEDILTAGNQNNYQPAVKQLVKEGPKLIETLLINKFNVPFERDKKNQLIFTAEAAHSTSRIIHCKDVTGYKIHNAILKKVNKHPNITIYTNHTAIDLLTYSHHSIEYSDIYKPPACFGAVILDNLTQQAGMVYSDQTILATGGLGQLYSHTTNPIDSRGDGIAMAWRAGARCVNLHYIQFHPTALYNETGRFLISEALRGEGGKLIDINGNQFMKDIHQDNDLAPRDIVARSIHKTLINTNHPCVYLDISHKKKGWIKNRFPNIYEHCYKLGIDISKKAIPVVPAAHYSCGGISVDLKGQTSLNRLYAIGEVSCTGAHGSNRLASTSLLECLVWGHIAGKNAALNNDHYETPKTTDWVQEKKGIDPALISQDWLTIKNTMWNYVGLIRTQERLHRAQDILRNLQYDIEKYYQKSKLTPDIIGLRNGIQTAVAITSAALEDRISKGCHYIES
jgi:L-aspartate oxidase